MTPEIFDQTYVNTKRNLLFVSTLSISHSWGYIYIPAAPVLRDIIDKPQHFEYGLIALISYLYLSYILRYVDESNKGKLLIPADLFSKRKIEEINHLKTKIIETIKKETNVETKINDQKFEKFVYEILQENPNFISSSSIKYLANEVITSDTDIPPEAIYEYIIEQLKPENQNGWLIRLLLNFQSRILSLKNISSHFRTNKKYLRAFDFLFPILIPIIAIGMTTNKITLKSNNIPAECSEMLFGLCIILP